MYTQPIKNSLALVPDHICKKLGITPDSKISMEVQGNKLIVTVDNSDQRKREKWIDKWFDRYRFDTAAHMNTMGNITAVELYGQVGISKPSPIDKYDEKTGIAVAYAKAHGASIPKYI